MYGVADIGRLIYSHCAKERQAHLSKRVPDEGNKILKRCATFVRVVGECKGKMNRRAEFLAVRLRVRRAVPL
jgi:hypothetical protein